MRVISANEARPLWNQKVTTGGGIVNIRRNQRLQFTGEVGVEALLKDGRDLPSRLDLVGGKWCVAGRSQVVVCLPNTRSGQEGFLLRLRIQIGEPVGLRRKDALKFRSGVRAAVSRE